MEIKDIQGLIAPVLKNKKYVSHSLQKFLDVGENYGSTILKLIINLIDENGTNVQLNCVAKLVPSSPYIWKVFNTAITFKKEIRMYDTIIPTLNRFSEERGEKSLLPFFGEYVGSRVSLNPKSDEVDFDAAIVLKDLSYDGYALCDRFEGFDKNSTELLLKDLATLHATVIAFKIQNATEFKEKILPFLNVSVVWDYDEATLKKYQDQYASALRKHSDCVNLIDKVTESMRKASNYYHSKPREPFATMIHNDLWTNNVLVKFQVDKPISNKFIDFQVMVYGNPACDVLFLIYSSAQIELLGHVDDFVRIYHQRFLDVLKRLGCDVEAFSLEALWGELTAAAKDFTFVQILFMLAPIYTLKGKAKDTADMTNHADTVVPDEDLHENFYRRLHLVVKDFAKRGWI